MLAVAGRSGVSRFVVPILGDCVTRSNKIVSQSKLIYKLLF